MKYGLNDIPPPIPFLLYGMQWWVVTLPSVLIMGAVTAHLHSANLAEQIWYMRKLFVVMGAVTAVQALIGHRLPLVVGPASTLLVGITTSLSSGTGALYTSIFLGGIALAVAGFTGLFARLRFFFTPRIVAVVLILIAFTLSPVILHLILDGGEAAGSRAFSLSFALITVFALVVINDKLKGAAKALTALIGMAGGAFVHCLFQGFPELPLFIESAAVPLSWTVSFEIHPGALLAFVFCFLALAVNEIGSIEAVGRMLKADGMDRRIRRGVGTVGVANVAAGGLGVIGPVDFSLSAGIIAATGCASRFPLVAAGLGLAICAFFPKLIMILSAVPGPVMGTLLFYFMASQLSSGLTMLVAEKGVTDFTSGIIVGLPLMIGLLIAFAPATAFAAFPDMIRPVVGNGFVMGTLSVILLEHGVFKKNYGNRGG